MTKTSGIQVYSGIVFDPLNPDPDLIDIRDIAHALSLQCRFSGHVKTFYSVAQHSCYAAFYCDAYPKTALLHDAQEAYIGDLASPLKSDPDFGRAYRECEDNLAQIIADKYGIEYPLPPEVKEVDVKLLATERRDLLVDNPDCQVLWSPWLENVIPYEDKIETLPPLGAELTFLELFKVLGGEV